MSIRKITGFIISVIIMVSVCFINVCAVEFPKVTDSSGKLPDIEINRLSEILSDISEKTGYNTAVIITDNLGEKNALEYTQSFYNEHYSEYSDSIILLINYDTNNDILYPTGKAEKYYTEDIRKKILSEKVENHLSEGNISDAVISFAENTEEIFAMELPEEDESKVNADKNSRPENYYPFLIIFGIISGIAVGIITGVYIKKRYKYYCEDFAVSNYQCNKEIKFEVKEDKFRREYINKSNDSMADEK